MSHTQMPRTRGADGRAVYHWSEDGLAVTSGILDGTAEPVVPGHRYVVAYVDRALSSEAPSVVVLDTSERQDE